MSLILVPKKWKVLKTGQNDNTNMNEDMEQQELSFIAGGIQF